MRKSAEHHEIHDRHVRAVDDRSVNLTVSSTLTVYDATSKETGLYRCLLPLTRHVELQHVYIDGKSSAPATIFL